MGKRGPQPKGEPYVTLTLNARGPLKRQVDATAKAQGTTPSEWLRWAVKAVLARGWVMPESAKNKGD